MSAKKAMEAARYAAGGAGAVLGGKAGLAVAAGPAAAAATIPVLGWIAAPLILVAGGAAGAAVGYVAPGSFVGRSLKR